MQCHRLLFYSCFFAFQLHLSCKGNNYHKGIRINDRQFLSTEITNMSEWMISGKQIYTSTSIIQDVSIIWDIFIIRDISVVQKVFIIRLMFIIQDESVIQRVFITNVYYPRCIHYPKSIYRRNECLLFKMNPLSKVFIIKLMFIIQYAPVI